MLVEEFVFMKKLENEASKLILSLLNLLDDNFLEM